MYKELVDRSIATVVFWYIDDGRPTVDTTWEGQKTARKIYFTLYFLGSQDAGRKRTDASQSPGVWAGTMIETMNSQTFVLASKKKW